MRGCLLSSCGARQLAKHSVTCARLTICAGWDQRLYEYFCERWPREGGSVCPRLASKTLPRGKLFPMLKMCHDYDRSLQCIVVLVVALWHQRKACRLAADTSRVAVCLFFTVVFCRRVLHNCNVIIWWNISHIFLFNSAPKGVKVAFTNLNGFATTI